MVLNFQRGLSIQRYDMEDNARVDISPLILPERYFPVIQENVNASIGSSQVENINSSYNSNTIIIRYPDENPTIKHVRMCTKCLKRINPNYYFSWEFMEFCTLACITKFQGVNFKCMYCLRFISNTFFGKFYIRGQKAFRFFCSGSCMDHYKMVIKTCFHCNRDISANSSNFLKPYEGINIYFCSKTCCEVYTEVMKQPKIPANAICCVCKQGKSIDIVLKHMGLLRYFCNKRCLVAYSFVKFQADAGQCAMCKIYFSQIILQKNTVFYENITLLFCSSSCQIIYMLVNAKTVKCDCCQNERYNFGMIRRFSNDMPRNVHFCSANCFKLYDCSSFGQYTEINAAVSQNQNTNENTPNALCLPVRQDMQIVSTKKLVSQRNVATMCFIPKANKKVAAKPEVANKGTSTDELNLKEIIFPMPVPIYVPTPMASYSIPVPTPVPFFLPVPVPVFVPITKQLLQSLTSDIENMRNKIPNDPCEAELLKIADIIAEEKVKEDSENLKEAQILDGDIVINSVDYVLETHQGPSNISTEVGIQGTKRLADDKSSLGIEENKRKLLKKIALNHALGTNALQQWVGSIRSLSQAPEHVNLVNTNILHMLPEELNFVLNLFIQNLKKPDGSEYAPDTLYYLCLGIQYYLSENGRSENIFMDKPFDKFSDMLNKFAEKFHSLYHEGSQFIVTRVEEEHLWETKQLGCHSPLVLLNTLVYFNTKYYHCTTLEQHLDISFCQILKLYQKKSKTKSVILRFHPKKFKGAKHLYEQYTNKVDKSRCPVSIYEFYLSKCPESVKSCNNLFYLQPEQYCTSDSPLWYMSTSLMKDVLSKMINRVKMVREVNVALISRI